MKLRIKSTGQVFNYDDGVGAALLATGACEPYVPPAPPRPSPLTNWGVRNLAVKDDGEVVPPAILIHCAACGSQGRIESDGFPPVPVRPKPGAVFKHDNPSHGVGCGVAELIPEHIVRQYEAQLKRWPRATEAVKSKLDQLREVHDRFAVRTI